MIETLRGLRAISWLRVRLLRNSIIGGRKRDSVEQASRALALIVPLLIVSLSIGTFLAVSIVGFIGGQMMADGRLELASGLLVVRLLLGLMVFTIVALAVVSPTQSAIARYTRLLLLPIHQRVLHLVEVIASISDPWIAVLAAGLTTLSLGILAGGNATVAGVAFVAGLLTMGVVVCTASLTGFLVAWLMRDRRRGELFTLVFVLAFSLLSFIPAFMSRSFEDKPDGTGRPQVHQINVTEFDKNLPVWTRLLPSEVYGQTIAAALSHERTASLTGLLILLTEATLLFMASARVHRKLLGSLGGDQTHRRSRRLKRPDRQLPFLSPGSSAVAWAFIRGAFRTVRGRLTILLPGPMLAMLVAVFKGLPQENWTIEAAARGYLLFGGSLIFTFYAMHALTMNFFGSDRAGLTMQLLAPVTDRELAWGKVVGFASVFGVGLVVCLAASLTVAHSGAAPYWIAVIIGSAATFFLISPVAIWFSALFPVASDLSKTGAGGNPHAFPMIAGTFCAALFSLPTVAILALAEFQFSSAVSAIVMAAAWLSIAIAIGVPLVNVASRSIGARRENLALVAQGK